MKEIQNMRFSMTQLIGILIIFILGVIFGYILNFTGRSKISLSTKQNIATTETPKNADTGSADTILFYNLQGTAQSIDGQTLTLKADNSEDYRVTVNQDTQLKKMRQVSESDPEGELLYDIALTDIQKDDYLYVESNDNIGESVEFTARYIEVLPAEQVSP